MPEIRSFRALRYDAESVGDIGRVVAPPYDVVGPDQIRALLAKHPKNAVRIEVPGAEGADGEEDAYRRAARTLATWRSDGTLRKDPRRATYVYEQRYRVPGTDIERTQRGFFARLRLEPLERGSGVLPHERTMAGPKEDRYRLLRATGMNTSPVVVIHEDPSAKAADALRGLTASSPVIDIVDDDDVRHRLWIVDDADDAAARLCSVAAAAPVVIADGHHRYETALRYRDERRMTRSCDEDPPFDWVLALLLPASEPLTVLPTHRIVAGLGTDGVAALVEGIRSETSATAVEPGDLVEQFEAAAARPGGEGRFGMLTRDGVWIVEAKADKAGGPVGRLDVEILRRLLERHAGIDPAAAAAGERISYSKSAPEAWAAVQAGIRGADVAFLLEPTPVADVIAVAKSGEVMPQKSTYFYPKALTGLVFNPHEW
ncbi:MAG: DUF1015 domain-containing protein [Chloroflexota bacterium]